MEATLLRRPTQELQLLVWSKQLKPIKFNEHSAVRFLSNAMFSLRQAQSPDRAPSGAYVVAHEGIYSLCLGSMYLHGLLPVGKEGQKELVVQLGCEMLLMPEAERDLILVSRRLLTTATTEAMDNIDTKDVHGMVQLGNKAIRHARRVYPDWFD